MYLTNAYTTVMFFLHICTGQSVHIPENALYTILVYTSLSIQWMMKVRLGLTTRTGILRKHTNEQRQKQLIVNNKLNPISRFERRTTRVTVKYGYNSRSAL